MRALVFCTTCRYPDGEKLDKEGVAGGERLARAAENYLKAQGRSDILVERQDCLWACKEHCNVLLRDTAKFSYLAGRFSPEQSSVEAIVQWFDLHGQSADGAVRFADWPTGMKGHFIARIPPATDKQ